MNYYVYILASRSRAIYDLIRRMCEHRTHAVPGHTHRYRITRLVHFEMSESAYAAIAREKQIKGWRREEKVTLIQTGNPTWEDLASGWFEGETAGPSLRSG
jgi:putative endonuclease